MHILPGLALNWKSRKSKPQKSRNACIYNFLSLYTPPRTHSVREHNSLAFKSTFLNKGKKWFRIFLFWNLMSYFRVAARLFWDNWNCFVWQFLTFFVSLHDTFWTFFQNHNFDFVWLFEQSKFFLSRVFWDQGYFFQSKTSCSILI